MGRKTAWSRRPGLSGRGEGGSEPCGHLGMVTELLHFQLRGPGEAPSPPRSAPDSLFLCPHPRHAPPPLGSYRHLRGQSRGSGEGAVSP